MEDNNIIEYFDKEMKRTTTFLEFLMMQPQMATMLTQIESEKLMVENLLRIKCCKVWAENMEKEVELKCSKEAVKAMNGLFKTVEVKKRS